VIARVRDAETQELLSTWYLLTNVDAASAELVALWYYWRWNIESYFKLMKSAGMELDHWQLESGMAILNRLLVASMAAATVWNLQRFTSVEATEFKDLLVKLSGKTVKRARPHTSGTLLSGLFVLLRIFDFLEQMNGNLNRAYPELVWRCYFNQGATNGSGKTPDQFQICSKIANIKKLLQNIMPNHRE